MKVPLVDLRASLEPIRSELFEEFGKILDGMQLFLGPNVQAFEREFADYCEVEHGVGVSSGTDALIASLLALQIAPGDEVIVPSLTFFASIEAIVHVGAIPVLVDVSPNTLTLDPEAVRAAASPATRAVMPVHLYGCPVDMDPILAMAREHGWVVVEDCAQAHGARYKGRRCGSMGDAGCFSFYFTKNLGAFGEAGFVTTRRPEIADRVRLLRDHGHASKFEHVLVGFNLRMDELQAAVLRLKLRHLEANSERRRKIARTYDARLGTVGFRLLEPRADSESVYHLYPLRCANRDALLEHLQERDVGTGIHYRVPAHLQPSLSDRPHRSCDLRHTEEACDSMLSLPMYPELRAEQVDYVVEQVLAFRAADGTGRSNTVGASRSLT